MPVKAAKAAGVPVINIDRNADGAPGDTFIATDSVEFGASQVCDWIAKQAGGKGEMLIIHGQKGTTPEVDRSKGCGDALKNYPDIKVVGELWSEGWHQDEGFKLTAGPAAGASRRPPSSSGRRTRWRSARRRRSRSPIPIISIWVAGFDGDTAALKALKDGVFDVTATQQTQKMGRMGLDAAIDAREGREAAGRAASGRDADDEGQRRRLHRASIRNAKELGGAPSRAARFSSRAAA